MEIEQFISKYVNTKKLYNFNPTNREGLIMFGLYIGLILVIFKKYGFGIIFWSMSILLYSTTKEKVKEECRESSINNPYANTLWENDELTSCKTDDKKIKENFEENLYRNESDLFDRKSMQAQYFNIERKFPNDINPFLKLMDSNLRCKDKNENCSFPSFL